MKAMTCEMCGSNQFTKIEGLFQCDHCGTKYTPDEAKKLMFSGTVEIVKGNAEKERLLNNAKIFINNNEFCNAKKTIDQLSFDYPSDEDVKQIIQKYIVAKEKFNIQKQVDASIIYLEHNFSSIISPYKLFTIIDVLEEDKELAYRLKTYERLLKDYFSNFPKLLLNLPLMKVDLSGSWDVYCTPEKTGLPEDFIVWIYFDSSLFIENYSSLLTLQEKASDYYYKLILDGKTRPTSYCKLFQMRDDYSKGFESYDYCEEQWVSAFGAQITRKYNSINDVKIKNIFLRKYFFNGIENAKRLNNEYSISNDRKLYFCLGDYGFAQDGFSSDYGPPLKYFSGLEKSFLYNIRLRQKKGLCQHCGGSFKGLFTKTCSKCGKPKDY